jgi:hypothetical protein
VWDPPLVVRTRHGCARASRSHTRTELSPSPEITTVEKLAQDPRIGRRYAGEQDGPLARGAAATKLVGTATEWSNRHPFDVFLPAAPAAASPGEQGRGEQARMKVDALADELGVHPGDVRVLLSWLDREQGGLHPDGTLLNEYGGASATSSTTCASAPSPTTGGRPRPPTLNRARQGCCDQRF